MSGSSDDCPVGPELLGRLLEEHGPALALYAAQWTDVADDCVQEALVELVRQRAAPANLRAWLFRVVKHRALNAARGESRRREREVRAAERRFEAVGQAESLSRAGGVDATALVEALTKLAAAEREIVTMKIWGGLTFAEIAAALESSTSAVHRSYRHALEQLRKILEIPCDTRTSQEMNASTGQSAVRSRKS